MWQIFHAVAELTIVLEKFGLNENNFIKANKEGDLFEAVRESVIRCIPTEWYNLKVEYEEGEAKLIPVTIERWKSLPCGRNFTVYRIVETRVHNFATIVFAQLP